VLYNVLNKDDFVGWAFSNDNLAKVAIYVWEKNFRYC